jgi:glutaconate CoA-transferase subunit A
MSESDLNTSVGTLFMPPDVETARQFFAKKSRVRSNKLMSVKEAVTRFIHDGDYLGLGGFGTVRISTAICHEILRQGRKNLGFSGHTATHDFEILSAGACIDRCDVAYIVGLEVRGLSPQARRFMESGAVEVTEWSNASLHWRYKAATMGVPFLPARVNLGTDTFKYSAGKVIECPFTGDKLMAVPALFPDVGVIHVHRADVYGNAQIDGITIADWELARASKHLIITAERIVETEEIRAKPELTQIPYWLTDAVCHVPYGSYPGNMPYEYYFDEDHFQEWLAAERDEETFPDFLQKYIFGTEDFAEYLELVGGEARMAELRAEEPLKRS